MRLKFTAYGRGFIFKFFNDICTHKLSRQRWNKNQYYADDEQRFQKIQIHGHKCKKRQIKCKERDSNKDDVADRAGAFLRFVNVVVQICIFQAYRIYFRHLAVYYFGHFPVHFAKTDIMHKVMYAVKQLAKKHGQPKCGNSQISASHNAVMCNYSRYGVVKTLHHKGGKPVAYAVHYSHNINEYK